MTTRADTTAFQEIINILKEGEDRLLNHCNLKTDAEFADAYKNLTDILSTGLMFYTQNDPERPEFMPVIGNERKFGGDNADAFYHYAPLNGERAYIMTINPGEACYFAFTVYGGSQDNIHIVSNVSLPDLIKNLDGNYEIELSPERNTDAANHILLNADTNTLVSREYFFDRDNEQGVTMDIKPLLRPQISPLPSEAETAKHFQAVSNFIRGWINFAPMPMPENKSAYNVVCPPFKALESTGHWTTPDSIHAFGFFQLEEDEALVLHGRSPECAYWGCNLWTPAMRTFDYKNHRTAVNKKTISYEEDGSWKLVIAHKDPGFPNWIQTAGNLRGVIYFRWFLSEELPAAMESSLIKI